MLAIPWYFTNIAKKPELYARLYLLVIMASWIWGMYAGTLVDRFDRKKIFMYISLVGGCIELMIATYGYFHGGLGWVPVFFAFMTTVFVFNIHFPNLYSFAQEITTQKYYGKVASVLEISNQLTFAIAGALGSMLLVGASYGMVNLLGFHVKVGFNFAPWKMHEIILMDAITYFVALLFLALMKYEPIAERKIDTGSIKQRLQGGMKFLWDNKTLFKFGVATTFMFATILVISTYLITVFIGNVLHQDADVFANAEVYFSIGALLAGVVFSLVDLNNKQNIIALMVIHLLAAFCYFYMGMNREILIFFFLYCYVGFANASIRILRTSYFFKFIPNRVIGRANGFIFMSNIAMRLGLTALFSLGFFVKGNGSVYALWVMAIGLLLSFAYLLVNKNKLQSFREADVVDVSA